MKAIRSVILAFSACLLMQCAALGQGAPASESEGKQIGGYQVQQSVELGYRFVDVSGSTPVYSTFINQNQGPRLLEQTLSMRAPEGQGTVFDDLYLNSFGWGGDPEN